VGLSSTEHTPTHNTKITEENTMSTKNRMPRWLKITLGSVIGIVTVPLLLAVIIGSVQGITGSVSGNATAPAASTSGGSTPTIAQDYRDCLALASKDNFAPEVCEGLNPNGDTAKTNCTYEKAHSEPMVDCPIGTTRK